MSKFDVYRVGHDAIPYVVDVQSDYLEIAETRVVVPLVRQAKFRGKISPGLMPTFDVEREAMLLLVTQIAAMPRRRLVDRVASLAHERSRIVRAIDTLLLGV